MVVNYDLPLMNERIKGGDEKPDIETYIHRIGQCYNKFCTCFVDRQWGCD